MITKHHVLVLNKHWQAINVISLKRAIILLFSEKSHIIDTKNFTKHTWKEWEKITPTIKDNIIRGVSRNYVVPEIIILNDYDKVRNSKNNFSRRMVHQRDLNICQYCGCHVGNNGTIDHILPRSRSGKSTWENVVCCCPKCNSRKKDRTPAEAGMKLLKNPEKPSTNLKFENSKTLESWKGFLKNV